MKAIIVTHPTKGYQACLFGIEYEKLVLLAEFRSKIKETIKKKFRTIEYKNEVDLAKKVDSTVVGMYKITIEQYKHEIKLHFDF